MGGVSVNAPTTPRKRRAISKKLRFEVFKRDKFKCQYCGKGAPDVVLVIDHIHPHSKGGANTILNLITACDPCNNGKGARTLDDDSVVAKQRDQLEQMQERRDQLAMMMEWQRGLASLTDETVKSIDEFFTSCVPGWDLSDDGLAAVRAALTSMTASEIVEVLRESATKHVRIVDGQATPESAGRACGEFLTTIKYRKQRERDPVGSELRYIRGIVRKRSYSWDSRRGDYCLDLLREAYERGVSLDELKRHAQTITCWSAWTAGVVALTGRRAS